MEPIYHFVYLEKKVYTLKWCKKDTFMTEHIFSKYLYDPQHPVADYHWPSAKPRFAGLRMSGRFQMCTRLQSLHIVYECPKTHISLHIFSLIYVQ